MTEQQLNSHFLYHILKYHSKLSNFCKTSFLIWCLVNRKGQNDCLVSKLKINFPFSLDILKQFTKLNSFCKKKFFDLMHGFRSDKMPLFLPNDKLPITFYVTFSNSIHNRTNFEKEFFSEGYPRYLALYVTSLVSYLVR